MAVGRIVKVSGPLIVAEGMKDARMFELARVSERKLIGEIIELHGDEAYIQVYEDTSGLGPGEIVESTGAPLSIELGPGLLQSIYDGIQRPLDVVLLDAAQSVRDGRLAAGVLAQDVRAAHRYKGPLHAVAAGTLRLSHRR